MVRTRKVRIVPQRPIPRQVTQPRTVQTIKKEQLAEREYKGYLLRTANSFINSIRNLGGINTRINNYLTQNLPKIPQRFRNSFRNYITKNVNKLKTDQNSFINKLRRSIDKWRQNSKISYERAKEKKRAGQKNLYTEAQARDYKTRAEEGVKLLQRLQRGELLKESSVFKYLNEKGRQQYERRLALIKREKFKEKEIKISDYVSQAKKTGEIVPIKQIQKELNIGRAEARKVERAIKSGAEYYKKRTGKVKELFENVDKGITYTDKELFKIGVSPEEQRRILNYQKIMERKGIKIFNKFSKDIANRIGITRNVFNQFSTGFRRKFKEAEKYYNENIKLRQKAGEKIIPLTTTEYSRFQKLPDIRKNQVLTYSILKTAKDNLPSQSDINALVKENKILKKEIKNLKEKGLRIRLSKYDLKTQDMANLMNLRRISDADLKKLILSNKPKEYTKLNLWLKSFNKYYDNIEAQEVKKGGELIKRLKKQIVKDVNSNFKKAKISSINVFLSLAKPFRLIRNSSAIVGVSNKLKKGEKITLKDYNEYKKGIYDGLGVAELTDKTVAKAKKNMSIGAVRGVAKNLLEVGRFIKTIGKETFRILYRDFSNLFRLLSKALGGVKDLTFTFVGDSAEALATKLKFIPQDEKKVLYARTRKKLTPIIKGWKSVKDLSKAIAKNPELIMLGTAIMIDAGRKGIRRTLVNRPATFIGEITSFFIGLQTIGLLLKPIVGSIKLSKVKYLKKIADRVTRRVTEDILKLGNKAVRFFRKTKIDKFDFDILTKNKKMTKALAKTIKETKAVIYGSSVEYESKLKQLRKFYSKLYRKRFTKEQALSQYIKDMARQGLNKKTVISSILEKPADIDLIVEPRFIKAFVRKFNKKYRYVPELAQKFYIAKMKKLKRAFKIFDFDLAQIRKNKDFVFSVLKKNQIDDLLLELVREPELGAFKIQFMQNMYKAGVSPKILRAFDTKMKLALKGTEFGIDIHKSTDVAFTKSFFRVFNLKQDLPFEIPKLKKFKDAIEYNTAMTQKLTKAQETAFLKLGNKYAQALKKFNLKIKPKKFQKNITKFLEKSKLKEKQTFDFLQNVKKKGVNKQILRTYYDTIDFTSLGVDRANYFERITADNMDALLRLLLDMSKKSAKILDKFELQISYLQEQRKVLLYYSTFSKKLFKKILKFDLPDFKLKEQLTPKEQEKLLKSIERYYKKLQKEYSVKNISKIIDKEIGKLIPAKRLPKVTKSMLDLQETVERDATILKKFKTERIRYTKDGIRYISPSEQAKRRVAGAVSTIFEDRRAKDIKKLYNDVKFIESLKRIELKKRGVKKFLKIFDLNKRLKTKLDRLKKLTKSIEEDFFRKEKIFTTKGYSETIGMKKIRFGSPQKPINKKELNLIKEAKKLELRTRKARDVKSQNALIQEARSMISRAKKVKKTGFQSLVSILFARQKSLSRSLAKNLQSQSKSISKSMSKLSKSISKYKSLSKSQSKSASKSLSKLSKSLSRLASVSRSVSKSLSKSASKSLSKSISKSQSRSKSISRFISQATGKPPKFPPLFFELRWDKKLPRGRTWIVNAIVRIKGRNKEIKLKTTPNRALKKARDWIDKTTSRSFQLKIVGTTKRKDISKPSMAKFRMKMSKGSPILRFVEKVKYAIDTAGEKRGLTLARVLKKKRKINKKKKPIRKKKKKKNAKKKANKKRRQSKNKRNKAKGRRASGKKK